MSLRDDVLGFLRLQSGGKSPTYVKLESIHDAVARYQRYNILKFVLDDLEGDGWVERHPDASKQLYGISEKAVRDLVKYDSSQWTGLPSDFVLTEQRRESLIVMLNDAELALDNLGADNAEKRMAAAYIVAARTLADAPDPPVDLIWEIIGRASNLAGIAALFVSIIALFQAAAH